MDIKLKERLQRAGKTAVPFLAGAALLYVFLGIIPEALRRDGDNMQTVRAEKSLFFGQAVLPIEPAPFSERVLVKASGQVFDDAKTSMAVGEGGDVEALPVSSIVPPEPVDYGAATVLEMREAFSLFSVPIALRPTVDFWKKIFAEYGRDQVVMHHRDDLGLVLSVLDFSALQGGESGTSPGMSDEERKRIRYRLIELERASLVKSIRARQAGGAVSERLAELAADPERIRAQTGIREKFENAISVSGLYMPHMERIFRDAGIPVELTRLPFIESTFDIDATSSVGAAGIWQFMESTGRLYLRVDGEVDERRDPILSSYAAAQFFQKMYDALEEWPLVINGYNTGHGRMMQAVRELGTKDIAAIIANFKHPTYQFASRNFYPEFLAALEIYRDRTRYFPSVEPLAAIRYDTFTPSSPISIPLLADLCAIPLEPLRELNPALSPAFFDGRELLPTDVALNVPYLLGDRFYYAMRELEQKGSAEGWRMVSGKPVPITPPRARNQ